MTKPWGIWRSALWGFCAVGALTAPTSTSAQAVGPAELYLQHLQGLRAIAGAARAGPEAGSARFRVEETARCQIAFHKGDAQEADPMSLSDDYFFWRVAEEEKRLGLVGPRDFYFDDTAAAYAMATHLLEMRFLCEDGPSGSLRPAARAGSPDATTHSASNIRNFMEAVLASNRYEVSALESDEASASFSLSWNQRTYFVRLTDCREGRCGQINLFVLIGSLTPDAVQQLQSELMARDMHVRLMTGQGTSGPVYGLYRSYSATGLTLGDLSSDFVGGGRAFVSEINAILGPPAASAR